MTLSNLVALLATLLAARCVAGLFSVAKAVALALSRLPAWARGEIDGCCAFFLRSIQTPTIEMITNPAMIYSILFIEIPAPINTVYSILC